MTAVAVANTGYLGIPLTALLLGGSQIPLSAAYDNVVNTPAIVIIGFGIGAVFGTKSGQTWRQRLKAFLTRIPPLYALIFALLMPNSVHPSWGPDLVHIVAMGIAPIGFFALGVNLMLEQEETGIRMFPPPLTPAIFTALGLRLLMAPAVMLGLSGLLLAVPHAFILEAAMPCGINALVVAHLYGLDMKITVGAIAWSTGLVLTAVTAIELFGLL
jgi:predicted permease